MKKGNVPMKPRVSEDTINRYSEEMSRKAVSRLCDSDEEPEHKQDRKTDSHAEDYSDDEYDDRGDSEIDQPERHDTNTIVFGFDEKGAEAIDGATKRIQSEPDRTSADLKADFSKSAIPRADTTRFKEKIADAKKSDDRNPEEKKPSTERPRTRIGEEDYDMTLYRRKKLIKDEYEDDDIEDIIKSRRRGSGNPEPATIKRNSPPPPQPRRKPATAESTDYLERAQVQRERDEQQKHAGLRRRDRSLRPIVSLIFFAMMVLLLVLLFQMNKQKTSLDVAEEKMNELNTQIEQYLQIQLEYGEMKKENETLKAELENYRSPSQPDPAQTGDNSNIGTSPTEAPLSTTLPTTYVVQSGDNLSTISKKFYSTPNQYQKIKDANSMTTDAIKEGLILTIPK